MGFTLLNLSLRDLVCVCVPGTLRGNHKQILKTQTLLLCLQDSVVCECLLSTVWVCWWSVRLPRGHKSCRTGEILSGMPSLPHLPGILR